MNICLRIAVLLVLLGAARARADEPLPSWNAGPSRQAILEFVARTTTSGSPDFVEPQDRIAVFDNDGTLWSEQPIYFQLAFALNRVKVLASAHPEWKTQQPFRAVLSDDLLTLAATGKEGFHTLLAATHSGVTTEEFNEAVQDWLATARHPRFKRRYDELVFQPMLELLALLRLHGFKTYIVSGGGIEFMRVFAERVYGVPPEQVIGSSIHTTFEMRDGKPVLLQLPELEFLDDKAGKPVAIQKFIGRRPIAAFGNSDGDLQMLQWTTIAPGPRFGLIVHHTDSRREWAYDRISLVGRLSQALTEAPERGWIIVNMKQDWKVVYPFELESR